MDGRRVLSIWSAAFLVMSLVVGRACGRTIYVDSNGSGDFESIQAAIEDANDADEIEVLPGMYDEVINFNGKAVRLYSEAGASVTIIDGTGHYHVVQCVSGEGPGTVLEGFTVTGGSATDSYPDDRGGGIYIAGSSPTVKNCAFRDNTASDDGGAMCNVQSSAMIANCTFSGNIAGDDGGAMYNEQCNATVINCTFTGNEAGDVGGGICSVDSNMTVANCILWYDYPDEVNDVNGVIVVTHSDVEGGTGQSWFGQGCIDAMPSLWASKGDLSLLPWSPCIDGGSNDAADGNGTDIAGLSRLVDGDCNGTAIVDMGAHEFRHAYMGDLDLNCYVDLVDFAVLALAWLSEPLSENWKSDCDISVPADGIIDIDDLEILTGNWLEYMDTSKVCLEPNLLKDVYGLDARGAADVLGEICGITDSMLMEEALYGCGYEPSEYLEFTAVEWVERFSPILYFDEDHEGLPMSAQVYFETVLALYSSYDEPAWSDPAGWDAAKYYRTIQTGDVDGDGKAELLGRASNGMLTYSLNTDLCHWYRLASGDPALSNSGGWDAASYYLTIQTADVDGDGDVELLARGADGMRTYDFNSLSNSWNLVVSGNPALTDSWGWDGASYYLTIQTADVDGDGDAELLARASDGMRTYDFNSLSNSWDLVVSGNPALTDSGGWDGASYYLTIQTADVDGDGDAELLARGSDGMRTYDFNSLSNSWDIVAAANPGFSDAAEWDAAKYYRTIQTADVDGDGNAELLARGSDGMRTYDFNSLSKSWQLVVAANPPFSNAAGWDSAKYYLTIQTGDVDGDGKAELLARSSTGMQTYDFNLLSKSWNLLVAANPAFSNAAEWDAAKHYLTIQTGDVDGDGSAELLARGESGMRTYDFNSVSNWWTIATEDRIVWRPDVDPWNGPCDKPGVESLCGRDHYTCGMQNTEFGTLVNGEVPTYYKVVSDIDSAVDTGPKGRIRIAYWWFYGFQGPCNTDCPVLVYCGADGAHHGDWEHIVVTTDSNRTRAEAVTYFFHGDRYTRIFPDYPVDPFDINRPVVYVGRLSHGSWHSDEVSCLWSGEAYHCCEYADCRTPDGNSVWYNTYQNLVSLRGDAEPWLTADKVGSNYEYNGKEYKISYWRWGPHISYCDWQFFGCRDWVHTDACGTHPTIDTLGWEMSSCDETGCGTDRCVVPHWFDQYYPTDVYYNQGWPWD